MPLFEYRCQDCGKQFTFLAGVIAENDAPTCPRCQSSALKKLMSRFSRGRSDDARMESLAEKLENSDFDDEGAARRFAREMGREMAAESGEDVSDEIEQLIEMEARGDDTQGDDGTDDSGEIGGAGGFGGAPDNTIY
jgi:putative FmdB family regulatory protein